MRVIINNNEDNMTMKKIVIITRNLCAGGAERVISQLANYLSSVNIECHIITVDKKPIFYTIKDKVKITQIEVSNNNRILKKFLIYLQVRKTVKKVQPDVVLAMPEEIGIYAIPSLLGLRIPIVISERNNPWIMPWKKVTRLFRKIFYPLADGFIFQTEQAASFFSKRIQRKSIILPNPIDVSILPKPILLNRRKEIVSVGRLEKQKNFPLLIHAFSKFLLKHPDYKLIIYGDGSLRSDLHKLAEQMLPEGTYELPGKSNQILNKINGASMFVLSSDYEGMPNVLIEAMSLGIPVISTNCPSGGPKSLINDGYNGILVPVNDEKSLTEAMIKIASNNELSSKLSENAIKIRNSLDINIVAINWLDYLTKIVNKEVK